MYFSSKALGRYLPKKTLDLDQREALEMHVPNLGSLHRIGQYCDQPQVISLSSLNSRVCKRTCIPAIEKESLGQDGAVAPM